MGICSSCLSFSNWPSVPLIARLVTAVSQPLLVGCFTDPWSKGVPILQAQRRAWRAGGQQTGSKPAIFELRGLHLLSNKQKHLQLSVLPTLLIAEEVAAAVRKSPKTIYKWAKQGRIPSVINIDGSILFDPDGTKKWIDEHRMAA